jgi:hypothetical protein
MYPEPPVPETPSFAGDWLRFPSDELHGLSLLFRLPVAMAAAFPGIKKGPRRPCSAHRLIRGRLPAPGDAPPKYDNKISHGDLARLHCFVSNLTFRHVDVKLFPVAGKFKFSSIVDRGPQSGVTPVIQLGKRQTGNGFGYPV